MVDYRKWEHVEVSDDEDETHPNIDTKCLFKWRHDHRVDRMERFDEKKRNLQMKIEENNNKLQTVKNDLDEAKQLDDADEIKRLEDAVAELTITATNLLDEKTFLDEEEKAQPMNVDTLSQPGFSRTCINKLMDEEEELPEDEQLWSKTFIKENVEDIKKYGLLHEYHHSEEFLTQKPHLACDQTTNYLVVLCIDLQVEEKHALMYRVAHQTICLQFLLELSKELQIDARNAIKPFFQKMRKNEGVDKEGFEGELASFIERVKERAEVRIEEAMEEYEEEKRKKRVGSVGADEVYDSLPKQLQEWFDTKDIGSLQNILASMPEEEAKHHQYHLKRCLDSGLWVPYGDANKESEVENSTST